MRSCHIATDPIPAMDRRGEKDATMRCRPETPSPSPTHTERAVPSELHRSSPAGILTVVVRELASNILRPRRVVASARCRDGGDAEVEGCRTLLRDELTAEPRSNISSVIPAVGIRVDGGNDQTPDHGESCRPTADDEAAQ